MVINQNRKPQVTIEIPFYLIGRIVLKRDEFTISSDGCLINHIDDFMEKFGMMKKRRDKNELFYLNMKPLRTTKKTKKTNCKSILKD